MADLKSKIPDISEITSMAGKLFKDVKKSITEIIADYKAKHPTAEAEDKAPRAESVEKDKIEIKKTKKAKDKDSNIETQHNDTQ